MRFSAFLAAFLFNPTIRVYSLRLLILITLAVTSGTVWDWVRYGSSTGVIFRVVTECLLPFHHISVYVTDENLSLPEPALHRLFVRKMPVAALDLFLTVLEIIRAPRHHGSMKKQLM
jgi:hypothetical protein